ncbi:MAG: EAL domain-containing protein, partial [Mizugakiibacter sp.]|uniref:EAL domain-containing response regulator n=1 Tax=Mizugakiibacter sp. TaxID=1972610 RepID=UPI00320D1981
MVEREDPQHGEELRQSFLRFLPQRLKTLLRRARGQCRDGWDVNALRLLHTEFGTLAAACGRYGLLELGERLYALESELAPYVDALEVPDADATARLGSLLDGLRPHIEQDDAGADESAQARTENGYPLLEIPPPGYWRQLGAPDLAAVPPAPDAAASAEAAPAPAPAPGAQRVCVLGDDAALGAELAERLAAQGHVLQRTDTPAALCALLDSAPPQLVCVGPHHLDALDAIGVALRRARAASAHRIALLAMLPDDDVGLRLRALRAGADSCVPPPAQTADVLARIGELLVSDGSEPYRVLIVEDDPAQALFAEAILRKAQMQARVLHEPLPVLDELDRFQPDLILMDLNLPGCDGLELTALIREREAFVNTPIVFLSGDPDTERQYAALDAGGDDFLTKPIRPKHLIAAVTSRVRRARLSARRARQRRMRDPATGLHLRAQLLDSLNELIAAGSAVRTRGGLLCVELRDARTLRERVGLAAFDALLVQAGNFIAAQLEPNEMIARFGDAGFLLLAPERGEAALLGLAHGLCERVARERFGGAALPLAIACGICDFAAGADDAAAMLRGAERALEAARHGPSGVALLSQLARADAGVAGRIRSALANDGLHLAFQAVVPIGGVAEEARFQTLLRLRGPGGRVLAATDLLPEAQRSGQLDAIDRWVLRRCVELIAAREREGRPLHLFASQSIAIADDPRRLPWLHDELEAAAVPRGRLVLEFRYDEVRTRLRALIDLAPGLRGLGVGMALSGLDREAAQAGLIAHLPLDFIKLTLRDIDDGMLGALVGAAHAHGRRVIVARVEDAGGAARALAAGADYLQGNFVHHAGVGLDYDFRT